MTEQDVNAEVQVTEEEQLSPGKIFVPTEAVKLFEKVSDLKVQGYRLGQICCTMVDGNFELLYSFDKEGELLNLKLNIPQEEEIMSITGIYWAAFVFENEMQDLFGVKIKHMALNYGGNFYKVTEPTPWNPKN